MNQPEADVIAHVRAKLGDAISWLRHLEQGVGCASMPDPPKPARAPTVPVVSRVTPPTPIKPLTFVELKDTRITDHELARSEEFGFGHGSYYAARVRLARAVLAAERQPVDRLWVDVGGEG